MYQNNQREMQNQLDHSQQQSEDEEQEPSVEVYSQDDEGDDEQNEYQQRREVELKRRFNLYDIFKAYREEGENSPFSRLLYVAYYNENIIQSQNIELDSYMQAKTRNPDDKDQEIFQGYFLIKGSFSIHLVEGESNQINNFVLDMYKEFHKEKSMYQNINIIAFTEENSTKCFEKWYCDNIYQAGPTLSQEIDKTEKQIQDRSWEIYNQICQAGKRHSQKVGKEKKQQKLATEITISTDDMSLLMSKNFTSIDDYYSLYLSDIEIQLDSELQYPFQPSLINVLEFSTRGTLENY